MEVTSNGANGAAEENAVKVENPALIKQEGEESLKRSADVMEEENGVDVKETPAKRRGVVDAAGDAVNKTPMVMLENIDGLGGGDSVATGSARGRGRGQGRGRGSAPQTPSRTSGRQKKATPKVVDDDDDDFDENEENEEEESEEDLEDLDDDEDEFVPPKKGRGRGRGSGTPRGGRGRGGRGRGRGRGKAAAKEDKDYEQEEEEEDGEDEEGEEGEEENGTEAQEDANNADPDAVRTGQYLIDKKDLRFVESFPIWRMEGPNMLRKFEMIVQLGRIRHKSLYAYSSWAQTMKDLFERIQVTQISSMDGDSVVEIHEQYFPKPQDQAVLEEKYSANEYLPMFQALVMILFRTAADANFLKTAYEANDASVVDTLTQVDAIVQDRLARIQAAVSIKDEFRTRVRDCPKMKSIRRSNWSQTDQATNDRSMEKGVRSVLLFGFGYDPNYLTEDKSRGAEVAQEVVVGPSMDKYLGSYHSMYHLKYHLLERCQNKAKLVRELSNEQPSIEKLMEDRCWILQAFEDFLNASTLENLG